MALETTTPIAHTGRQMPRRPFSTGSVREVETVLRSWGLGDRHASVACAWVVAEASSHLADGRLRLVEQADAADDRRRAAYVRAVAAIFAQATGRHPQHPADGGELRSFEAFLIACLRLIMPLATPEDIQAICWDILRDDGRPLHA